jgi:phosphoribosylanthranilate isomerase
VTRVKICGITTVADARACAELGADALGLNFVPTSPRRIGEATARDIVRAVGDSVLVVGVVAGFPVDRLRALREATGVGCLQLHGGESAEDVAAVLPHAYAAIGVAAPEDVARAESMPGDYVMVDARVEGALGGTGRTFDWGLVVALAQKRKLVLAGGLTPANVAAAVAAVHPWCVDVASGVESAPGVKDLPKVKAFIEAARGSQGLSSK